MAAVPYPLPRFANANNCNAGNHELPPHPHTHAQVAALHGELGKQSRQSVLEEFSRGDHRILLVSDVAARGIDIAGGRSAYILYSISAIPAAGVFGCWGVNLFSSPQRGTLRLSSQTHTHTQHTTYTLAGVDAVFNLELPSNAAHYAHRAGRTGRMGALGVVISVAAPAERFVIDRMAARLGVPIEVR